MSRGATADFTLPLRMLLLDWIDTLGLLPPDDLAGETEVLNLLNESSKRAIVLEAVAQLSSPTQRPVIMAGLSSWAKVASFLELIGPCLSLGLEDLQSISRIVDIYLEWLQGENLPPGVSGKENEETFQRLLIRHLSQMFRVRKMEAKGSVAQLQIAKQVELCRAILKVFTSLTLMPCRQSTMKTLMLVALGIADSLLRLPLLPPCQLADDLSADILASLVEIWLRSQSLSSGAWKSLKTYYRRWCHRLAAVSQWTAVSLALTQRISKHLYGQGTDAIVFGVHGQPVSLEGLNVSFEMFAWKEHLLLLSSPSELPPSNCLRAVMGVEMILQVFYSVGQTADPSSAPIAKHLPDGNTLLALFGKWLFDAASLTGSGEYIECCAHATGILCRLFSKQQFRASFHDGYLRQFYQVLDTALRHPSLLVTVFICINCEDLLTAELPAIRILAPSFLTALRRLVPRPDSALQLNIRMEDLRRACYKLLFTLFAYGCHFGNDLIRFEDVQPSSQYSEQLRKVYLEDNFTFAVIDTLLGSLLTETDPGNQRYLLNSLSAASIDQAADARPGFAQLFATILSELLSRSDNTADPETATIALQSLLSLREVHIEGAVRSKIVMDLCKTVELLILSHSSCPLSLLELAVDSLVSWSVQDPAAILCLERSELVIAPLTKVIDDLFQTKHKELAQLALTRIIVGFGPHFSSSPLHVSSQLTEFEIMTKNVIAPELVHYFVLNRSILACLVETNIDGKLGVALVIRTATGRYTWIAAPRNIDSNDTDSDLDYTVDCLWKEFQHLSTRSSETQRKEDHFVSSLDNSQVFNDVAFNKQMDEDSLRVKNLSLMNQLCIAQDKALNEYRHTTGPAHLTRPHRPSKIQSLEDKMARMLLAHLGLLSPNSAWLLQPLPPSPDLYAEILSLDSLPERETLSVSVFYVRSGLQSLTEILLERRISQDFLQFVGSLGWPVSNGETGLLHLAEELGDTLTYYCNDSVELLYHVAPLLPRPTEAYIDELKLASDIGALLAANQVAVIWLEDDQEMLSLPSKFGCPLTLVYICIIPMAGASSDGLYRVRIMVTAAPVKVDGSPAAFTFGPLLDGMILRRQGLGELVRATVISASIFCLYHLSLLEQKEEMAQPAFARASRIEALSKRYASLTQSASNLESVYATMLFPEALATMDSEENRKSFSRNSSKSHGSSRHSVKKSLLHESDDSPHRPDIIVSPGLKASSDSVASSLRDSSEVVPGGLASV